ncbi:hypothetical protein QR98_0022110 [Sarcoptes scabiei]|uniref:Uncharacterized protein n=1 Tax=Sarcoptes scabiei TaxID=52283 RepID=A0A131ZYN8_SARSC|nr:hypothetical protein QR98_0022110 [Sarcoptes scabiei]
MILINHHSALAAAGIQEYSNQPPYGYDQNGYSYSAQQPPTVPGPLSSENASFGLPQQQPQSPSLANGSHLEEQPHMENSNRHKLMNNRLKTLIQNRQNQKEMIVQNSQPGQQPSLPSGMPQYVPQQSQVYTNHPGYSQPSQQPPPTSPLDSSQWLGSGGLSSDKSQALKPPTPNTNDRKTPVFSQSNPMTSKNESGSQSGDQYSTYCNGNPANIDSKPSNFNGKQSVPQQSSVVSDPSNPSIVEYNNSNGYNNGSMIKQPNGSKNNKPSNHSDLASLLKSNPSGPGNNNSRQTADHFPTNSTPLLSHQSNTTPSMDTSIGVTNTYSNYGMINSTSQYQSLHQQQPQPVNNCYSTNTNNSNAISKE